MGGRFKRLRSGCIILLLLTVAGMVLLNACARQEHMPVTTPSTKPVSSLAPAPVTAEQYYEQGIALSREGQYEQAIRDLTKAIELDPGYAKAYYERSKIYAYSDEWDKAIADCDRAIEIDPVYAGAYYVRGNAFVWQKEYARAINDLGKFVEFEISKQELRDLKEITDLVIPPGELILLDLTCSSEGGIDCSGKPKPYNTTLHIQLFVNPGEAGIEINKIYIAPPLNGTSQIRSPIRYFKNMGLEHLVTCLSSPAPPTTAPRCSVDYKLRYDLSYKKSNELISSKMDIGRLICPR